MDSELFSFVRKCLLVLIISSSSSLSLYPEGNSPLLPGLTLIPYRVTLDSNFMLQIYMRERNSHENYLCSRKPSAKWQQ